MRVRKLPEKCFLRRKKHFFSRRIGIVLESLKSLKKGVDITPYRAYNIHVDLKRGINSVVECHLAKVKVASSNLVSRSKSKAVSSETAFLLLALLFLENRIVSRSRS